MTPATGTVLALALFPTGDHHEFTLGSYGHQLATDEVPGLEVAPLGLDIHYRRVFDTLTPEVIWTGDTARLRVTRDASGAAHIDQLEVETVWASVRIRPELGDKLDVGLLLGSWDETWLHGDNGASQWRLYSPMTLTGLGLANNDMDDADRIKWYAAVGAGLGGHWIRRVRGPLGIQARADTGFHSRVRWNPGDPATTRHEWWTTAEVGLGWLTSQQSLALVGWGETITQWDPRDAGGRDGIDRHYRAAGLAVSGRIYQGRPAQAEPDLGLLAGELEAEAAMAELEEADLLPEADTTNPELLAMLENRPDPEPQPQAEEIPTDQDPVPKTPIVTGKDEDPEILTVHWSELQVREQASAVTTAADKAPKCTLRFVLDAEGVPSEVRPAMCPEHLLEPATAAGLRWRFEPFLDGGRAIPVQVVFPIQFEPPP